jgi:hypothetical protein
LKIKRYENFNSRHDDKIAGSWLVKYKEKEGMYDLYKFKVNGKKK